jgi:transcriptional regulator with XRE-family HTH domain
MRSIPDDFAGRLRAARAYMGLSQRDFATLLDLPGVSEPSLKMFESGKRKPPALSAPALIDQLATITQLPEMFFWGEGDEAGLDPTAIRLGRIEIELRLLRGELASHDAEEARRIAAALHETASLVQAQQQ